jgi:hypothetical protein
MSDSAWLCALGAVLAGFACGGRTGTQPDAFDGSADAAGALDVVPEAAGDRIVADVLAKWQKLGLDTASGPCPPQATCSASWVVSPDGQIAKTRLVDAGFATMTTSDRVELDSIVSSAAFIDGMTKGFTCERPPTDVSVSLRLDRDGASHVQNVTGCVFNGPAGNLPRRVNELVTKY